MNEEYQLTFTGSELAVLLDAITCHIRDNRKLAEEAGLSNDIFIRHVERISISAKSKIMQSGFMPIERLIELEKEVENSLDNSSEK